MSKETLQNYNTRLNVNNTSLDDILDVVNVLPEIKTTEIRITPTNEEQVVMPEEPYIGFSKVTVGEQSGIDPSTYFNTIVTSANAMYFGSKYLLTKIPPITLDPSVTTIEYMFQNMEAIESVAPFDTSNVKSMASTFKTCRKLKEAPFLNTSNVTTMDSAFNTCNALTVIPNYDFSKVKNMSMMFQYCTSLKTVQTLNTPSLVNASYMFGNCTALETVGQIEGSNLINISQMFQGSKPNFKNFGGIKDLGKGYLTSQSASYSNYTLTLLTCTNLTHESLMNVINNLYDIASLGVQPQKLSLGSENLAKLTADEIAIATNKGWNVS